MAGIAIPDNLRPALTAIAKYHFWILAALVPLLLIPMLFLGGSTIRQQIKTQQGQIESKLGQVRAVTSVASHPNENWTTAIDADTEAVTAETLEEWRRFWHSQRSLRVWPPELGDDFLSDVTALEPGGKLDRQSLVRYQNMAPRLVRSLPTVMGVRDEMVENRDGTTVPAQVPGADGTAEAGLAPPLAWDPASQRRLYASFVWQRVPNTTQVLLAQEELWVYGVFCRLLADFVASKQATGAHDSPLTLVEDLAVGFPANVEGTTVQQGSRIFVPKPAAGSAPDGMAMPDMPPMTMSEGPGSAEGGAAEAPWHPRFTSGQGGRMSPGLDMPTGGEQPARSPEDDYRGWIYCDFSGKPLSVAELTAAADMQMVHLMPFRLRVVVDQRELDRLVATLAAASIPIDVRQVRINPGVSASQMSAGDGMMRPELSSSPAGGGSSGAPGGRRPFDVVVELRGSVALATSPPVAQATAEPQQ